MPYTLVMLCFRILSMLLGFTDARHEAGCISFSHNGERYYFVWDYGFYLIGLYDDNREIVESTSFGGMAIKYVSYTRGK